jgi:hypothetical protein
MKELNANKPKEFGGFSISKLLKNLIDITALRIGIYPIILFALFL